MIPGSHTSYQTCSVQKKRSRHQLECLVEHALDPLRVKRGILIVFLTKVQANYSGWKDDSQVGLILSLPSTEQIHKFRPLQTVLLPLHIASPFWDTLCITFVTELLTLMAGALSFPCLNIL